MKMILFYTLLFCLLKCSVLGEEDNNVITAEEQLVTIELVY